MTQNQPEISRCEQHIFCGHRVIRRSPAGKLGHKVIQRSPAAHRVVWLSGDLWLRISSKGNLGRHYMYRVVTTQLKQFVWRPANHITYIVFCRVRPSTIRWLWAAHVNPLDTSVAKLLHEALLLLLPHDVLIE